MSSDEESSFDIGGMSTGSESSAGTGMSFVNLRLASVEVSSPDGAYNGDVLLY